MDFVLAQTNFAVPKYSIEDPAFSGFVDNLERINALAEGSPGFVWRYISDDDDAEARRVFANDRLLFNMSTWESLRDLRHYVYQSDHVDILRDRSEWFIPQQGPTMALWWQPAGEIPSVTDAWHRLECLRQAGAGPDAFTFRSPFEPPDR